MSRTLRLSSSKFLELLQKLDNNVTSEMFVKIISDIMEADNTLNWHSDQIMAALHNRGSGAAFCAGFKEAVQLEVFTVDDISVENLAVIFQKPGQFTNEQIVRTLKDICCCSVPSFESAGSFLMSFCILFKNDEDAYYFINEGALLYVTSCFQACLNNLPPLFSNASSPGIWVWGQDCRFLF